MQHKNSEHTANSRKVYVAADNLITSLGFSTAEHLQQFKEGKSGISYSTAFSPPHENTPLSIPIALIDKNRLEEAFAPLALDNSVYTILEKLFILSIDQALQKTTIDPSDPKTLFLLASTKGSIDLLEQGVAIGKQPAAKAYLGAMTQAVRQHFKQPNPVPLISNACISGVLAIMIASRLLKAGVYDHAVIAGGDILTEFVVAGFLSLKAISPTVCQPYDARRRGITLGEACGTLILTTDKNKASQPSVIVAGGASSNDANHISSPSRDGYGLLLAIEKARAVAQLEAVKQIDYISAHGTATRYNDEMEAKAFNTAGLANVPLNSMKGYWGHTLGAAGLIESVMAIQSLQQNILFPSKGFEQIGISKPLNIITKFKNAPLQTCLKTASGFGGCNAALIFHKL